MTHPVPRNVASSPALYWRGWRGTRSGVGARER
jgi:hypothetical protein